MSIKMGKIKKKTKNSDDIKYCQECRDTTSLGKTTWDDKLAVSYKVKHVFITWPSDCALKKLLRKIKTDVHTKAPSTHAHNSFTCDG